MVFPIPPLIVDPVELLNIVLDAPPLITEKGPVTVFPDPLPINPWLPFRQFDTPPPITLSVDNNVFNDPPPITDLVPLRLLSSPPKTEEWLQMFWLL